MERTFNVRLFERIKHKYETQRKFAKVAGINEGFLSEVVNGKRVLPVLRQRLWAAYLDTTSEEIFRNDRHSSL